MNWGGGKLRHVISEVLLIKIEVLQVAFNYMSANNAYTSFHDARMRTVSQVTTCCQFGSLVNWLSGGYC
jgi:hypothetical protein